MKKAFITFSNSKWCSRTFLGFIVACVFLGIKWIPPTIWLTCYLIFMGENFFTGYYKGKLGGLK